MKQVTVETEFFSLKVVSTGYFWSPVSDHATYITRDVNDVIGNIITNLLRPHIKNVLYWFPYSIWELHMLQVVVLTPAIVVLQNWQEPRSLLYLVATKSTTHPKMPKLK